MSIGVRLNVVLAERNVKSRISPSISASTGKTNLSLFKQEK